MAADMYVKLAVRQRANDISFRSWVIVFSGLCALQKYKEKMNVASIEAENFLKYEKMCCFFAEAAH
jgi:hypothetical protein